MPIINHGGAGKEKINGSYDMSVIAKEQIQIGDVIYTIKEEATQEALTTSPWSLYNPSYISTTFSPDGSLLVVCAGAESLTHGSHVYKVNGQTLTFSQYLTGTNDVVIDGKCGVFTPDGNYFYCLTNNRNVECYHVVDGHFEHKNGTYTSAYSGNMLCISPDGSLLVVSGKGYNYDGIMVFSINESGNLNKLATYGTTNRTDAYHYAGAFSPDGTLFVDGSSYANGFFQVYTVSDGAFTHAYSVAKDEAYGYAITSMVFSPSGSHLVVSCENGVYVYSVNGTEITGTGQPLLGGNNNQIICPYGNPVFISNGYYLFVGTISDDKTSFSLTAYNAANGSFSFMGVMNTVALANGSGESLFLSHSPASNMLIVSGHLDQMLYAYSTVYSYTIYMIGGIPTTRESTYFHDAYNYMAISPDGSVAILGTYGPYTGQSSYDICSITDQGLNKVGSLDIVPYYNNGHMCQFSPDGSLFFASDQNDLHVFGVNGTEFTRFSTIVGARSGCALSDDGTKLLCCVRASSTYSLVYYSMVDGPRKISEISLDGYISEIAFSLNGDYAIAIGNLTNNAVLYQVSSTGLSVVANVPVDNDGSLTLTGVGHVIRFPDKDSFLLADVSGENAEGNVSIDAIVVDLNDGMLSYEGILSNSLTGLGLIGSRPMYFSPDGKLFVMNHQAAGIEICPYQNGKIIIGARYAIGIRHTQTSAVSPDGTYMLTSAIGFPNYMVKINLTSDGYGGQYSAYRVPTSYASGAIFSSGVVNETNIGFAKNKMNVNDFGKARMISGIKLDPVWG